MTETLPDDPTFAPAAALRLSEATALHTALSAAADLGLVDLIGAGVDTVDALAREIGADRRLLGALVEALVSSAVLCRAGDRLEVDLVMWGYVQTSQQVWGGFVDVLRTGAAPRHAGTVPGTHPAYPVVVPYLARRFAPGGPALLDALRPPQGATVLDVGAGEAIWSMPFAQADPFCQVTAIDRGDVLAIAAAAATRAGVADQYRFHEADVHDLQLTDRFDVVIVANLLHLFDPTVAAAIVNRLAGHVAPGGTLAVVDVIVPSGVAAPAEVALYALSLTLRTEHGGLFSFAACASWLRAAGLGRIHQVDLPAPPLSAVVATLPS